MHFGAFIRVPGDPEANGLKNGAVNGGWDCQTVQGFGLSTSSKDHLLVLDGRSTSLNFGEISTASSKFEFGPGDIRGKKLQTCGA